MLWTVGKMAELLGRLVDAPFANMLILAGLTLLGIGVIGKISRKIEPNAVGRGMSAALARYY